MYFCRACLVALLLAFSLCVAGTTARAASLEEVLAHFTADDFSETDAGINEVAPTLDLSNLATGSYRLEVRVIDADGAALVRREARLELK